MTFPPHQPTSVHTPTGPSPYATPQEAFAAIEPHLRALHTLLGPAQRRKTEAIFLTTSGPGREVSGIYQRPDTAHAAMATAQESQALCHAIATLQDAFRDSPFGANTPDLELRLEQLASGKCRIQLKAPNATYVNPTYGKPAASIRHLQVALDACTRVQPSTARRRWMVCADPGNAFSAASLEDAVLLAQAFYQPEHYTALCEGRPAGQSLPLAEIFTDLSAVRARIPHHLAQYAPVPQDG